MEQAYRHMVTLPSARTSYRQLFTGLADPVAGRTLYHCTAGKDRTGWATAALLLLLGVPRDTVDADFLAGNAVTLRTFRPALDRFAAAGGDPELLRPVFEVQSSYLEAALDVMASDFGSIDGYFADGLGLDREVQHELRRRLVVA